MLWRCVFVTHLLVILVLGCFYWGQVSGLSPALRRAEAFNVLVFSEIGYCVTTRFIKASTFHKRAFVSTHCCLGVPVLCLVSLMQISKASGQQFALSVHVSR